jgi:hypothetical protein
MAIQLRRGLESLLNKASLVLGEPAFCSDSKKLFISNGDGTATQALTDSTHANGSGQANTNKTDHAIYADGSSLLYISVSAAITLTNTQFGSFIKLTGTTYTVGVPTPVGNAGKIFELYNAASGVVTLSTPAGNFNGSGFNSASTYSISSGQNVEIVSDGSNWFVDGNSKTSVLLAAYPVGSIYMSVSSANPSTLFGGTWVAWGAGRVPVGVNTGDINFSTVEKTGGEDTHTLTTAEMPSHNHGGLSTPIGQYLAAINGSPSVGYGGVSLNVGNPAYPYSMNDSGGGLGHNNLQPYITCYMWKRTA